jgi:hypothetical protein
MDCRWFAGRSFGAVYNLSFLPDNADMLPSVDKVVADFKKASRRRRKNNTPAKARAFLIAAGIAEEHKGSPNGIRLAKPFR